MPRFDGVRQSFACGVEEPDVGSVCLSPTEVEAALVEHDGQLYLIPESARNGTVMLGEGEILEVDPPRRLVQTMVALWSDDVKREGPSRITWEIEQVRDSYRLTVCWRTQRRLSRSSISRSVP